MLPVADGFKPHARWYADQLMPYAVNRMNTSDLRRWERLYLGKLAEMMIEQHLNIEYGMEILPEVIGQADEADGRFIAGNCEELLVDIKTFNIFRTFGQDVRTPERVEAQSWALVPSDQFRNHPKDIYVFGFLLGNVFEDGDGLPDIEVGAYVCSLAWAPRAEVAEWEFYRSGSRLFPYFGTQTDNVGMLVRDVHPMDELMDFLEG